MKVQSTLAFLSGVGLVLTASADTAAATAAGVDLDVAYCESTGAQYIDTGILGNPGLRVEAEIMWTDPYPSANQHIIGSYDMIDNGATARRCYAISSDGSRHSYLSFGERIYYGWFVYTIYKKYRVVSDFGASTQTLTIDSLDGSSVFSRSSTDSYSEVASGQTLYLFALGHGTDGVALMTKARIYSMKIYQNGTLVRDYRPARQGSVYGLWEDVDGVFCGSATETPFKGTVPRVADGEPDYYAQWIQSNGSTYINTDIVGKSETKLEATFQWKAIEDRRLIGASKGNSYYFHISSGSSGEMWFRSGSSTVTIQGAAFAVDTDYTVVADVHASSQTYSVTGPFGTITTNDSQTAVNTEPSSIFAFAENTNTGLVGGNSKVRLYSMKIWQDGALVRDFVPGVKNGEGCLYDRANDKCYLSGGDAIKSAAGLVGPPADVPTKPKYELEYLGSEGNSYIDTGILGNPGLRVEAEIMWTDTNPTVDQHILSSFDKINNGNTSWRCYPISMSKARYSLFYFGENVAGVGWFTYTLGKKYRVVSDFGASTQTLTVDKLDGSTVFSRSSTGTYSAIASGQTLYLFAMGNSTVDDGVKYMTKARIYSMKIYQGGSLVRNYVPVIADNGGPYLYDKVTKTFHQGATSGLWDIGKVGERFPQGMMIFVK